MGSYGGDNELASAQFTAGSLAYDYVTKLLASEGFTLRVNQSSQIPERLSEAMLSMCDLFNQRFQNRYISQLRNAYLGVNSEHMDMRLFSSALDSLFNGGISWSRIVAMYAFGGFVALTYARQGRQEMAFAVPGWIALYVCRDVTRWINDNGGWDGFVGFSQDVLNGHYEEGAEKDSAAILCR
uniref:Bcl-2 Bcl-2 homology region 1-3 domain-containing protein n=1 Tax=Trichuris muris TaxID=70415 RepID=A0A5S6QCC8_TRIMR